MATILAFRRETPHRQPAMLPGHSAQLYFFTGVRYERTDEDKAKAPVAARGKRSRGAVAGSDL